MSENDKAGIKQQANVKFTLHVHLDDGTTKDIECVGTVVPDQPKEVTEDGHLDQG